MQTLRAFVALGVVVLLSGCSSPAVAGQASPAGTPSVAPAGQVFRAAPPVQGTQKTVLDFASRIGGDAPANVTVTYVQQLATVQGESAPVAPPSGTSFIAASVDSNVGIHKLSFKVPNGPEYPLDADYPLRSSDGPISYAVAVPAGSAAAVLSLEFDGGATQLVPLDGSDPKSALIGHRLDTVSTRHFTIDGSATNWSNESLSPNLLTVALRFSLPPSAHVSFGAVACSLDGGKAKSFLPAGSDHSGTIGLPFTAAPTTLTIVVRGRDDATGKDFSETLVYDLDTGQRTR